MLNLIVTAQMLGLTIADNARKKLIDRERGSFTLEQVVIAAALLLAAVGLVAIITTAITNRAATIS